MAQATDVKPRTVTFSGPPALALLAIAFATVILIAALVVPTLFTSAAIQPRTEAELDAGRAWQLRSEQMSGAELRRERYEEAVLQSGRDWEARQKQMSGE
jgi:hypothetical protein